MTPASNSLTLSLRTSLQLTDTASMDKPWPYNYIGEAQVFRDHFLFYYGNILDSLAHYYEYMMLFKTLTSKLSD